MMEPLDVTINFCLSIFFFLLSASFTFLLLLLLQSWSFRLHRGIFTDRFNFSEKFRNTTFWRKKKIPLQFLWMVSYSLARTMDMGWFMWDIPRPGHRDSTRLGLLEGMSQGPLWHSPFCLSPRLFIFGYGWERHSCASDLQTCPSEFVSSKGN